MRLNFGSPGFLMLSSIAIVWMLSTPLSATKPRRRVEPDPHFVKWKTDFIARIVDAETSVPKGAARAFAERIIQTSSTAAAGKADSGLSATTCMTQAREGYWGGSRLTTSVLGAAVIGDSTPLILTYLTVFSQQRYEVRWDTSLFIASGTPWIRHVDLGGGVVAFVSAKCLEGAQCVRVFDADSRGFYQIESFVCDSFSLADVNSDKLLDIVRYADEGESRLTFDLLNHKFVRVPTSK